MFTLLTAWISQRIITVTAVSVLTVAAVPTTLVIVSRDDHRDLKTVAVIQPADNHSRVILVGAVKKAGDALIAKLNSSESSCNTQLTQAVSASKLAAKAQPALATARSRVHGGVAPLVKAIQASQDRFAHLTFITPQDEENELEHIKLIEIMALGDGKAIGTVTVTCQTVLVTIQQTIQITVIQVAPAPCPRPERDDD